MVCLCKNCKKIILVPFHPLKHLLYGLVTVLFLLGVHRILICFTKMDLNAVRKLPIHYSGKFKGSYAYITIKDRLPVILVKVVDTLCKDMHSVGAKYGEDSKEEVKRVIGRLSALQNEMVTNKPIIPITSSGPDVPLWNSYLKQQNAENEYPAAWFDSSWLYSECYLYRRMKEAFELSSILENCDPFYKQKEESLIKSMDELVKLGQFLNQTLTELRKSEEALSQFNLFEIFLQISLWGNKCDLSLFAGRTETAPHTIDIEKSKSNILINDSKKVWNLLKMDRGKDAIKIHYILDNYGFELFCDFCFLHYLFASNLVHTVTIHVKKIPWFVSDTMEKDINIFLEMLLDSENSALRDLSSQWQTYISSGKWKIEEETFWTLPHDYSEMSTADLQLYQKLSQSNLVVFKGDLNYRKLTGDRQWNEEIPFITALNQFLPTSLLALRTIKADVIVGLKPGTTQKLDAQHSGNSWRFSGEYALIQFAKK